ncbi:MAG: hypothetical protein Q4A83_05620 [Bacillota bacterium]|nr:hypothetical protein [Bacillota bacterium]
MKAKDKRKTVVIICASLIIAMLILFAFQMSKMGVEATLFFDEYGLPTIAFDLCGVLFGVILIVMGRYLDESKKPFKKLCRVIGILEIACAVIYFVITQILIAMIK